MPHLVHRSPDLLKQGPVVEVIVYPAVSVLRSLQAKKEVPPSIKCLGLIDTGATITSIDQRFAAKLGLIARNMRRVLTPTGVGEQALYEAAIALPLIGNVFFEVQVLGATLDEQPYGVLIGRDILKSCTLIYNGWDDSYTLHL